MSTTLPTHRHRYHRSPRILRQSFRKGALGARYHKPQTTGELFAVLFSFVRNIAIALMLGLGLEAFDLGLFDLVLQRQAKQTDLIASFHAHGILWLAISAILLLGALISGYVALAGWSLPASAAPPMPGSRRIAILAMLSALVVTATAWTWRDLPASLAAYDNGARPLKNVRSWTYYLSKLNVDRIASSPGDMLVIDYATHDGRIPLTKAEVVRVGIRPAGRDVRPAGKERRRGGGRRLVISYLSIGEAESYRFYWKREWDSHKPAWHVAENCAWPRNHMVRFWHKDWKRIIFSGPRSYLKRIIDAGFDGVYLDRVDVYGELLNERPSARADMIDFVAELAKTARAIKPGFIVIAQNAEDLLTSRRYRQVIDGLGKEDLLYGMEATGERNSYRQINSNERLIRKLQWDLKPIFAVEYLADKTTTAKARRELASLGMVATFAHRDLDGLDPALPRPPSKDPYGTPEWIARECVAKGRRYW